MSDPKVEFLFDFGSPNAYLSHRVIPAITARTGVAFIYVPVLLGGIFKATGNQSPGTAFAHIRNKLAYETLEIERFVERHGLHEYLFNPFFPVNTLNLMRGAVAAQKLGLLAVYVDEVFRHMWAQPKKLDEPDVLLAALRESGLGGQAETILSLSQTPEVKSDLIANTEAAVARGVFGAPSFFVDGALYFGKDRLGDVEKAIVTSKAAARAAAT
uniref:2-hydroxychromene-2-carboxylate isomerase n=1 Tax=Caulobacter sp. (strain K31) TaxID=366602 RepID=B0T9K2_CAUSK